MGFVPVVEDRAVDPELFSEFELLALRADLLG
jgi:hypothetical protein